MSTDVPVTSTEDAITLLKLMEVLKAKAEKSCDFKLKAMIERDLQRVELELDLLQETMPENLDFEQYEVQENRDCHGYEPFVSRILTGGSCSLAAKLLEGCAVVPSSKTNTKDEDLDETTLPDEWKTLAAPVVTVKGAKKKRSKKKGVKPEIPLNELKQAYEEFLTAYFS